MKTMLLEGTTHEWMRHRVMPSVKYTKKAIELAQAIGIKRYS